MIIYKICYTQDNGNAFFIKFKKKDELTKMPPESLWFDHLITFFTNDQIEFISGWTEPKQWHICERNYTYK